MADGSGGGGFIAWLDAMLGGAGTTLVAAVIMRLIRHNQEVQKRHRKMFGPQLLFEPPVVVGMAIIADALGNYMGLSHAATVGMTGVLSWYGMQGAASVLDRWLTGKIGGKE